VLVLARRGECAPRSWPATSQRWRDRGRSPVLQHVRVLCPTLPLFPIAAKTYCRLYTPSSRAAALACDARSRLSSAASRKSSTRSRTRWTRRLGESWRKPGSSCGRSRNLHSRDDCKIYNNSSFALGGGTRALPHPPLRRTLAELAVQSLQLVCVCADFAQASERFLAVQFGVMTRPDPIRRASDCEPAWLGGVVLVGEDGDEYGTAAVDVLRVDGWGTAVRIFDVDVGGESRVGAEVEEEIE
jgi:hypothetical protein